MCEGGTKAAMKLLQGACCHVEGRPGIFGSDVRRGCVSPLVPWRDTDSKSFAASYIPSQALQLSYVHFSKLLAGAKIHIS